MDFGTALFVLAVCAVFFHIMWVDFTTFKIRNNSVLGLFGLYLLHGVLNGFSDFGADLAAAALLFLISLVFWLMKAMGAGDVKLYGVLGLLIGLPHLALYVVLLLVASCLFLLVLAVSSRSAGDGPITSRLRDIRTSGKAPYGVLMCISAIPVVVLRAIL